jgi:5-oxoprolinase (ATP-hydrolysing) subunit A
MTQVLSIDLNADLGEGGPCDGELLALVSSVNISCGSHAGDKTCIRAAIQQALALGVRLGAHPSYPDRENYGRQSMPMTTSELQTCLIDQLSWLRVLVQEQGGELTHVKPHGALYNDAADNITLACLIAETIRTFDNTLQLVGLAGSELQAAAHQTGLSFCGEAFVDRAYQANGRLLPRTQPGALLDDPAQAVCQAMDIIMHNAVQTDNGARVPLQAQTLCIHGDTPHALEFARQLHRALADAGVNIESPR